VVKKVFQKQKVTSFAKQIGSRQNSKYSLSL